MLSVTIGADRRLRCATLDGLAVDTLLILLRNVAVAGAAKVWHRCAKLCGLGAFQFVRRSMAGIATRRCPITVAYSLSVYAALVITYHVRVAGGTRRLGNAFGMGISLMPGVAVLAGEPAVGVVLYLVCDVTMAGNADLVIRRRLASGTRLATLGARIRWHEDASRQQH